MSLSVLLKEKPTCIPCRSPIFAQVHHDAPISSLFEFVKDVQGSKWVEDWVESQVRFLTILEELLHYRGNFVLIPLY